MKHYIERNLFTLRQGEALLQRLSDADYTRAVTPAYGSTIGAHIRHNLDHYACFLRGLRTGRIDYAARARESRIERDRAAALAALIDVQTRFAALPAETGALLVRLDGGADDGYGETSIRRELDFLLSHTIHHYAIVAILCRLLGVAVDDEFGVAPSTLRYRAGLDTACAR